MTNIAIIKDQSNLKNWEDNAVKFLLNKNPNAKIKLILENRGTKTPKINYFKNFIYIFVRLFIMRPSAWSVTKFDNYRECKKIIFYPDISKRKKGWQAIPEKLISEIQKKKIDIIFKFGMGLLDTSDINVPNGILSYHHGDPSKYRGRPAGFYEILNNENYVGAMVQKINNNLDQGEVLSFSNFKVFKYSYKKTLQNLYYQSSYLLNEAFQNVLYQKKLDYELNTKGKLYKLPNNFKTLNFLIKIFLNLCKRIFQILFLVKKWNIGQIKIKNYFFSTFKINIDNQIKFPKEYEFIADPFFFDNNSNNFVCEGLNKRRSKGEILLFKDKKFTKNFMFDNHVSFPMNFTILKSQNEKKFLFETIQFENLYLYNYQEKDNAFKKEKKILNFKCIDPVYFNLNDYHFLFVTPKNEKNILRLYVSKSFNKNFEEHPSSPIKFDAIGSRMAGKIHLSNNKIFRLGQIDSQNYGDGIAVFEISKINDTSYEEKFIKTIKFDNFKGPHTLSINNDQILYDYYYEKFDLFALYKKIKNIV